MWVQRQKRINELNYLFKNQQSKSILLGIEYDKREIAMLWLSCTCLQADP